jgi:hypothetical protein
MELSKIISTSVAIGALAFASFSYATLIELNIKSGTTDIDISAPNAVGFSTFSGTLVDGWTVNTNTALAGSYALAPDIFSLSTTASQTPGSNLDLTITAIATNFTDPGNMSAHFAAIGADNTVSIDYKLSADITNTWLSVANYNASTGATALNVGFGAAPLTSYDLRIQQIFSATTNGSSASVAVPEPSIIALFGLGLVGMGVATRRKQKQA